MTEKFDFGKAIQKLKDGKRVARTGWNGKGIYLELQQPDEHSKMTLPYIYIVTNSLITDNVNIRQCHFTVFFSNLMNTVK